jgi:hypothetical protein
MTIGDSLRKIWAPALVLFALALLHLGFSSIGEPFKNGDETRHVMTGVFFRDAIADAPASLTDPRGYAVRYYVQYPALGIITWPPFFYLIEGVAMWTFGTSYTVARLLVYLFALVGGSYAYRLYLLTHGWPTALAALAVFGLAPVVFSHCGCVLLEVPTLALVLGSVFHFERYISNNRWRDAVLACLFAAFAALTRFDAILLLPFALLRLGFTRQFGLLLRRPVLVGLCLALGLTVPYYIFTWRVYGSGIQHAAASGTGDQATSLLDLRNFYLYPSYVPELIGWFATCWAAVGLVFSVCEAPRRCGAYLALLAATYLMFVPLAEPEARHAIYFVPALALLVVRGAMAVAGRRPRIQTLACIVLVAGVAAESLGSLRSTGWKTHYVYGTGEAAGRILAKSDGDRPVMYDGQMNGAFIYAVRRGDPGRRIPVIRADKLLYSVFSDPKGGYEEYTKTDQQVIELVHRYDPGFIVVEEPQIFIETPVGHMLRRVLRDNPGEYSLEETIPFRTNHKVFATSRLLVYRKLKANPDRIPVTKIPVMALGDSVKVK